MRMHDCSISISSDGNFGVEVGSLLLDLIFDWAVHLGFHLENVVVIDVSGKWVELVNHGVILWSVWQVVLVELDAGGDGDNSSQCEEFHILRELLIYYFDYNYNFIIHARLSNFSILKTINLTIY